MEYIIYNKMDINNFMDCIILLYTFRCIYCIGISLLRNNLEVAAQAEEGECNICDVMAWLMYIVNFDVLEDWPIILFNNEWVM